MTVRDMADSKPAKQNKQTSNPAAAKDSNKKNMPCKNSLPT